MSLLNFVSQVQENVVLNPKFSGIRAKYVRRVENKEGDLIKTQTAYLNVSPQGNFVASDKALGQLGVQINVIWAKTADLKFDGVPFLPEENDTIEYTNNGVKHRYLVVKTQDLQAPTNFGQRSTFNYEDALHRIIKITTIKE